MLETVKLLFIGFHVEEVRAWIFNPLEMFRDEKHKGGLEEHFASKPCGSKFSASCCRHAKPEPWFLIFHTVLKQILLQM